MIFTGIIVANNEVLPYNKTLEYVDGMAGAVGDSSPREGGMILKLQEKTISKNTIYEGKIIHVRVDDAELENGHITKREVVEHPGGVCIAALTERNELLFVRQFRYPYGEVVLGIPAGKLEKGEDPLEAAKRELKEETGAEGTEYRFLGNLYPTPGYCNEIIRLFGCRVSLYGENSPDEDEFLETIRIPVEKAAEMVMNNEIPDGKTQVLVLKVQKLLKDGKF